MARDGSPRPLLRSDTASTLQCSVGPGLPNNRVVVKKTPQAILLEHGTGNATIVSQPMGYCGGEAYLVDQVLVPCSDVSAIMGEIANVPSPCKNNVEVGGTARRLSVHAAAARWMGCGCGRGRGGAGWGGVGWGGVGWVGWGGVGWGGWRAAQTKDVAQLACGRAHSLVRVRANNAREHQRAHTCTHARTSA